MQSRKDEEQSLQDVLDHITQQNAREVHDVESALEDARSTADISRLRQEEESLRTNHGAKANNLKQTICENEAEMRRRIESEQTAGAKQLDNIEKRFKSEIDQFEKHRAEIEE